MMENGIERPYKKILNWTALISGIINFITIFFPIFQVNILGFSEMEPGIKYLIPFIDSRKESSFMKYLQDAAILKILLSLMIMVLLISFVLPIFKFINRIGINLVSDKSSLKSSYSQIIFAFIINAVYYVISLLTVFVVMNDWHFEPVITYTYIPFIFQFIVFIVAVFIYKHYKKSIAGQVAPLSFNILKAPIVKKQNQEDDKVNLLIKYKELLDNGVITDAEYQEMKEKILKGEM